MSQFASLRAHGSSLMAHGSLLGLVRRERLHPVEDADGLKHNAAYDLEAAGAEFVECVFRRVPIRDIVTVGEVNQVHGGNASLHKRDVVIGDFQFASKEMRLVS